MCDEDDDFTAGLIRRDDIRESSSLDVAVVAKANTTLP